MCYLNKSAQPLNEKGIAELNENGEEQIILLEDQHRIPPELQTAFVKTSNEIITISNEANPTLTKVNLNTHEVTKLPLSFSYQYLITSEDGRLFGYRTHQQLIQQLDPETGNIIRDIIDNIPTNLFLNNLVFSDFHNEIFARGTPYDGVESLYRINLETGQMKGIPFQVTNVNNLLMSNDGRLFGIVDYTKFVQMNPDDTTIIKYLTNETAFSNGVFNNSTNEIIGGRRYSLKKVNVNTGEINTKELSRRYQYYILTQ